MKIPIRLFALVILLSGINAFADKKLTFGTGADLPLHNNDQTGFLNLVANEAFRRIGVTLNTIGLPAERSLLNANAGVEDGDLNRIGGLQRIYPNLNQVPEPIMVREFAIFTKKARFKVEGWSSLKPYSVGYITGWKIAEKNIKDTQGVVRAKNASTLFSLLDNDRVDVVFFERWMGLHVIKRNNLKNIRMLQPPLVKKRMYIYLHKKHKALLEKVSDALVSMKKDGTYQKLYDKTLGSLQ